MGRTVIQLLKPTEGKVIYKGMDLAALPAEEMRKLRMEIQIIFQDPYASLKSKDDGTGVDSGTAGCLFKCQCRRETFKGKRNYGKGWPERGISWKISP